MQASSALKGGAARVLPVHQHVAVADEMLVTANADRLVRLLFAVAGDVAMWVVGSSQQGSSLAVTEAPAHLLTKQPSLTLGYRPVQCGCKIMVDARKAVVDLAAARAAASQCWSM